MVDNRRLSSGKTARRTVLYLGELAYSLQVTLKNRLALHVLELTPAAVLDKLSAIQMINVLVPAIDGRWLILPRYTQPEKDTLLLLQKLRLEFPAQPPRASRRSHPTLKPLFRQPDPSDL